MKIRVEPFIRRALVLSLFVVVLTTMVLTVPAQRMRSGSDARATKDAPDIPVVASLVGTRPIGRVSDAPEVVDPTSVYSNVTTFSGTVVFPGGAAADPTAAGNTITRIHADDIVGINTAGSGPPYTITAIKVAVGNLNAGATSARMRLRFWLPDGANGGPGTFITGLTYPAFSFTGNQITILNGTIGAPFITLPQTFWAGVQFDNNVGATGAGVAELNNLGIAVAGPVDRGSSLDRYFLTTQATNFNLVNNPPGTITDTAGVVDNYGWEFTTAGTVTSGGVEVSGRLVSNDGRGIRGASVSLTAPDGTVTTVSADRSGNFRFSDVESGRSYVLSAVSRRYSFDPIVVQINDNVSGINLFGNSSGR